jgi:hypothetical protein
MITMFAAPVAENTTPHVSAVPVELPSAIGSHAVPVADDASKHATTGGRARVTEDGSATLTAPVDES